MNSMNYVFNFLIILFEKFIIYPYTNPNRNK